MSKRSFLSSMAVILCIMASSFPSLGDEAGYPMNITDSAGRTVTLPLPVQRVIPLNTNAAEVVTIIDAVDKVVGVDEDIQKKAEFPDALRSMPTVGKWNNPNLESIAEIARDGQDQIRPDIVVITYPEGNVAYGAAALEKGLSPFKNITVVGFKLSRPENMSTEIARLGQILGRDEEAKEYLSWYDGSKKEIEDGVRDLGRPRVYVEWNSKGGLGSLSTIGKGSAVNNQITFAGGQNIAESINSTEFTPKVAWEWIVAQDPEVIISMQSTDALGWEAWPSDEARELEGIRDEMMNRPSAQRLSAVKNGRVYVITNSVYYGLDSIVGLMYFAQIFHPELDLDPLSLYQEYLQRMGRELPQNRTLLCPTLERRP